MAEGSGMQAARQSQANGSTPRHGASVEIYKDDSSNQVKHLSSQGEVSTPLMRSYSDGVRIGCTFITNNAVEHIYKLHKKFLEQKAEITHQAAY